MRQKSLLLILPAFLLLTACQVGDKELVLDFVNTWLESRGMVKKDAEGNYKPTMKAAGVAMGISSGDKQVDAAIQGGGMVKDIAENDKKINQAKRVTETYGSTDEEKETAKKTIDAIVNTRPDDWYYRNVRATVRLKDGDLNGARKDYDHAERSCNANPRCLAAYHRDRIAQWPTITESHSGVSMNCDALKFVLKSHETLITLDPGAAQYHQKHLHNGRTMQGQRCP